MYRVRVTVSVRGNRGPRFSLLHYPPSNHDDPMSPTVFREKGYRFFFFSREESRMHVHVYCGDGEAKYWLEPRIELTNNYGLSQIQLNEIEPITKVNIKKARHSLTGSIWT